jgi:hypothetical protein
VNSQANLTHELTLGSPEKSTCSEFHQLCFLTLFSFINNSHQVGQVTTGRLIFDQPCPPSFNTEKVSIITLHTAWLLCTSESEHRISSTYTKPARLFLVLNVYGLI